MKPTLIISVSAAVLLNLWQFFDSYSQQRTALGAHWLPNTPATMAQSPGTAKAAAQPQAAPIGTATAQVAQSPATAPADPMADAQAKLSAAGLSPEFAALYLSVQAQTGTPWQLLAAVHKIETGQRGDTSVHSYAGAQGPMQFMPATFAHYASDGDSNGTASITDVDDAMLSAGKYLAANGAAKGNYSNALYRYNHSQKYVDTVTRIAIKLGLL